MPYKASSYAGLREVMLSEEGGDYSLRAKIRMGRAVHTADRMSGISRSRV